eukprot:CAMPEP_0194369978 /NCGR_PEP_ID=MMETSP0174-20130528/18354_1 /TAXON_ID=216777 /ORGANISM="Proboscia alata, Strain PI-D3" /LENGTH=987 /DNA_ID=CAMNT_0039147251 /DNA_START=122 /DNA_END=3085 /DNA_ORIENTATION=-
MPIIQRLDKGVLSGLLNRLTKRPNIAEVASIILKLSIYFFTTISIFQFYCTAGKKDIATCQSLQQVILDIGTVVFGDEFELKHGEQLMVTLSLSTLFASLAAFLLVAMENPRKRRSAAVFSQSKSPFITKNTDNDSDNNGVLRKIQTFFSNLFNRIVVFLSTGGGDPKLWPYLWVMLILPTFQKTAYRMYEKFPTDKSDIIRDLANPSGISAVIALSWFMVPVSRQSPLLVALGVNPILALKFHIWAGRLCLFFSVIHTLCYLLMYEYGRADDVTVEEELVKVLIPSWDCWKGKGEFCYGTFRNFTGLVSVGALILLTITSLNVIRRNYYKFFYISHIILGTLMLVFAIAHWGAMQFYILPSLIYYLACTAPVVIQSLASYFIDGGCRILTTTFIADSGGCAEIVIDRSSCGANIDESGLYVRICCPELSLMWHPFTEVSTEVFDDEDGCAKLKLLFRVYGSFTQKLFKRLEECRPVIQNDSSNKRIGNEDDDDTEHQLVIQQQQPKLPPIILIDGFYNEGSDWSTSALKHDVVLMVTGGIGVTPMLTLVLMLYRTMNSCVGMRQKPTTRRVDLHWYCRDEGLIRYTLENYISKMIGHEKHYNKTSISTGKEIDIRFSIEDSEEDIEVGNDEQEVGDIDVACEFNIVVHLTSKDVSDPTPFHIFRDENDIEDALPTPEADNENKSDISSKNNDCNEVIHHVKLPINQGQQLPNSKLVRGREMRSTNFAVAQKYGYVRNLPSLTLFVIIFVSGIAVQWWQYMDVIEVERQSVAVRLYGLYIITAISLGVGIITEISHRVLIRSRTANKSSSSKELNSKLMKETNIYDSTTDIIDLEDINKSLDAKILDLTSSKSNSIATASSSSSSSSSSKSNKSLDAKILDLTSSKSDTIATTSSSSSSSSSSKSKTRHSQTTYSLPHRSLSGNQTRLSIRVDNGRPIMNDVIQGVVDGAKKPSLFLCGPEKLLTNVKNSISRETNLCSVYEEHFEM